MSFAIVLGSGLFFSYRATRKDWHAVTVYQTSKDFWGDKKKRTLISGQGINRRQKANTWQGGAP